MSQCHQQVPLWPSRGPWKARATQYRCFPVNKISLTSPYSYRAIYELSRNDRENRTPWWRREGIKMSWYVYRVIDTCLAFMHGKRLALDVSEYFCFLFWLHASFYAPTWQKLILLWNKSGCTLVWTKSFILTYPSHLRTIVPLPSWFCPCWNRLGSTTGGPNACNEQSSGVL